MRFTASSPHALSCPFVAGQRHVRQRCCRPIYYMLKERRDALNSAQQPSHVRRISKATNSPQRGEGPQRGPQWGLPGLPVMTQSHACMMDRNRLQRGQDRKPKRPPAPGGARAARRRRSARASKRAAGALHPQPRKQKQRRQARPVSRARARARSAFPLGAHTPNGHAAQHLKKPRVWGAAPRAAADTCDRQAGCSAHAPMRKARRERRRIGIASGRQSWRPQGVPIGCAGGSTGTSCGRACRWQGVGMARCPQRAAAALRRRGGGASGARHA